jgi:hypothetical protein
MIESFLRLKFHLPKLVIFFVLHIVNSQEVMLSGIVNDSLQPLAYANIIAFPDSNEDVVKFAISNEKGGYKLKVLKDITYTVKVSYLGYGSVNFSLILQQNTIKNIVLIAKDNVLEEVVVSYKVPIEVKEDTIIYNTDAFVNGQERKLREVLKKLPGVEVDREGNVKVKGKKVTKVMVDGKTFFTGNSKLAVNNIPANVIGQIEILDNYSEVGFLKGLQDSDQIAMNIHLKEDSKEFIFGDVEVGGGIKNRYLVNPTLFYYSPKTNINIIGDLNNTGQKSFTLNDYLEFEGGFSKLMGDMKSYFNLYNDDFAKYLGNDDFKENKNQFVAFNIRQALSPKTDLNAYVITNGSTVETETNTVNQYSSDTPLIENRIFANSLNNFFVISKITLEYEPNTKEDLALNSFVKLTENDFNGAIGTISSLQDNDFKTLGALKGVDLKQNLEYSRKFSRAQVLSAEATLAYQKNRPNFNWVTSQRFLGNLIPMQDDSVFNVFQQKESENISFDLVIKDYWVLNNFNHIYTTIGTNLVYENYYTEEYQRLTNGSINNFSANGFGNDIAYRFNDTFIGLEYKFLTGAFTIKPALFYHEFFLKNEQLNTSLANNTSLVLPELKIEVKLKSSEELNFQYGAKVRFPTAPKLISNFLLTDFNQVFRGNVNLTNERYHSISLNYTKYSIFSGLNINAGIYYNRKTQSTKFTTELQGIDQFRTLTMFYMPENSLSGRFIFNKKIKNIKFGIESNVSYNEFFQIVNSNTSKNISKSFSNTGKIETFFKKIPNLEIGYTYSPSKFLTTFGTSNFSNNKFFTNLEYNFLSDFQLKVDYSKSTFENSNRNVQNNFDMANTSLFYQKEDSEWGFEVEVSNIFDTKFKQQSSFSDFLITDQRTFILPRMVMLKVSYKL